jgi:outer membrane protein OmpA-like peptidoglycan-associated protein
MAAMDSDPAVADLAGLERLKARQAIAVLQVARSKDREQALYLAQRRIDAADAAAHAELLQQQSAQLDRERDQIMIEASRIAAQQARREAEILRMQKQASDEEAQRLAAAAEAERVASAQAVSNAQAASAQARKLAEARSREAQLARKEAELASAVAADSMGDTAALPPMHRDGGKNVYTLSGSAFATGRATLTGAGLASLNRLAGVLGSSASLRIEGFTDSQGSDAANLNLSRQRADAVRRALIGAGLNAGSIQIVGRGKQAPVADNGSAEGRARNRRVDIIVQ